MAMQPEVEMPVAERNFEELFVERLNVGAECTAAN